jgi:S1-C subfamily serine protease
VNVQDASRVRVKLWDGREFDCDPVIVGITNSDVALVKIHAPAGEKFQPIKLAQDDDLMLGETVIAIGNPLNLGGSVTKGILSSRSRRLAMSDGPLNFRDWLQTDAAINAGNSGGPLVNLKGEMIGLNEAVVTNQQKIGFAIPVKQLQKALSQLFTPEVLNQIWFGGQVNGGHGPLHFDFVEPDSPAFRAGIRVSDEVVNVNGIAVQTPIQFHRALCGSLTNRNVEVKMVVRRNGESYNTTIQMISFDNFFRSKLGITVAQGQDAVVIETVEPDSPAAVAQLQPGFLLVGMDGKRISNLLDAANILSTNQKGDVVSLNLVVRLVKGLQVQMQQGTVNVIVR